MNDIVFREASLNDKPVLLEFEQHVIQAERPFNSAIKSVDAYYYDMADLLNSKKSHLLVAEINGVVVASGYAQIRTSKQSLVHDFHSYLGFMYVVPEFRGRGINKSILERLIQWSTNQGISDCYLDVYSGNEAAIRAYQKAGFVNSMIEMKLNCSNYCSNY
jgi:ribosomal protein S18 acetylase RimI-like enzyme